MISFEEIKKYLPHYLSNESLEELFSDLKDFPHNIDKIYSRFLLGSNTIYQGDGIDGLLVFNLPDTTPRPTPCVILSNTCDINPSNTRYIPSRVAYAPVFNLKKYQDMLINKFVSNGSKSEEQIESHIFSIKKQHISNIFYLPKGGRLENDSIVFLDRLNNCSAESLEQDTISDTKIFTLSNYGFYMFLVKISIHFSRVREDIDRDQAAA